MNSPQISLVPKILPGTEVRYETFKKMLVQTVLCQAAALDLRNGRATVLALRQIQYDNTLRLMTLNGNGLPGWSSHARNHPLFRYHGVVSWPPVWTWTDGVENDRPKGEIGILRKVELSNIQPADRCFLYNEHEGSLYIGCLLFEDSTFRDQVVTLLQNHRNQLISEIGSLDISHPLRRLRPKYPRPIELDKLPNQSVNLIAHSCVVCAFNFGYRKRNAKYLLLTFSPRVLVFLLAVEVVAKLRN